MLASKPFFGGYIYVLHNILVNRETIIITYFLFKYVISFISNLHFDFVCFGVFRPTQEFFTHIEMLPLSVKGCKF